MKSRSIAALIAAALLTSAVPAAALTPSAFYIFGDSFTDAGNIAAATGNTIPDPALGYWQGRFADGRTGPIISATPHSAMSPRRR